MLQRCIPNFDESGSSGYSLVEVLLAMTIALVVMAGALTLALGSRRLYETDQIRNRLSANLQAGRELLVTDVRQVGERLNENFPAIVVTRGGDLPGGSSGDPDELILRRNLLSTVLRICEDADSTDGDLVIAVKNSPPPGCAPLPVEPGDTYPSNLQAWTDQRIAAGGTIEAYLFDPVAGTGEFFVIESEGENGDGFFIHRPVGSPNLGQSYLVSNDSRIYILEERRYRISNGTLQLLVDGDTSSPINLVDSIDDFQVRVLPKPTAAVPDPAPLESFPGVGWKTLRSVELSIQGSAGPPGRQIQRGWTTEIMPRNVF